MNKQFSQPVNTLNNNSVELAEQILASRNSTLSLVELEPLNRPFSNNGLAEYCEYNANSANKVN